MNPDNKAPTILLAKADSRLTFERLEGIIRKRSYGVLSTVSTSDRPHSAGVAYAVSDPGEPFALHIVTDRRSKKARNVAVNPQVSFVIPIPRWLGSLPPSSIQFQGTATVLPLTHEECIRSFYRSFVTRRVLKAQVAQKADVSAFIRIKPDPVIFTYGIGLSVFQIMKHVERAAVRVELPP